MIKNIWEIVTKMLKLKLITRTWCAACSLTLLGNKAVVMQKEECFSSLHYSINARFSVTLTQDLLQLMQFPSSLLTAKTENRACKFTTYIFWLREGWFFLMAANWPLGGLLLPPVNKGVLMSLLISLNTFFLKIWLWNTPNITRAILLSKFESCCLEEWNLTDRGKFADHSKLKYWYWRRLFLFISFPQNPEFCAMIATYQKCEEKLKAISCVTGGIIRAKWCPPSKKVLFMSCVNAAELLLKGMFQLKVWKVYDYS